MIPFAKITMMDRILYCCLIIVFLKNGIRDYKLLIAEDLIGKLISLFYAMYCCKDIVFRKISTFYLNFREMMSYIISMATGIYMDSTPSHMECTY